MNNDDRREAKFDQALELLSIYAGLKEIRFRITPNHSSPLAREIIIVDKDDRHLVTLGHFARKIGLQWSEANPHIFSMRSQ